MKVVKFLGFDVDVPDWANYIAMDSAKWSIHRSCNGKYIKQKYVFAFRSAPILVKSEKGSYWKPSDGYFKVVGSFSKKDVVYKTKAKFSLLSLRGDHDV